jgi:hypothetical protein
MSSLRFLAMTFCCSVLYGLLRRLRTSRAFVVDTTLTARDAAFEATMMADTTLFVGISREERECEDTTESATLFDTQAVWQYGRVSGRGRKSL